MEFFVYIPLSVIVILAYGGSLCIDQSIGVLRHRHHLLIQSSNVLALSTCHRNQVTTEITLVNYLKYIFVCNESYIYILCNIFHVLYSIFPFFISDNVDYEESKSLFETNYSHVYFILYDTFIQAEANLKQKGNFHFRFVFFQLLLFASFLFTTCPNFVNLFLCQFR